MQLGKAVIEDSKRVSSIAASVFNVKTTSGWQPSVKDMLSLPRYTSTSSVSPQCFYSSTDLSQDDA